MKNNYVKCRNCGEVIIDNERKLSQISYPCPICCDKSVRTIWPSPYVTAFLELSLSQDNSTEEGKNITVVFISSALEVFLENILYDLLLIHTNTQESIDVILEAYQGRNRRIMLFNKISSIKLKDILKKTRFNKFLNYWEKVSSIRNSIIHGKFNEPIDYKIIKYLSKNVIEVFMSINSEIQKQKKAIKEQLEKES